MSTVYSETNTGRTFSDFEKDLSTNYHQNFKVTYIYKTKTIEDKTFNYRTFLDLRCVKRWLNDVRKIFLEILLKFVDILFKITHKINCAMSSGKKSFLLQKCS